MKCQISVNNSEIVKGISQLAKKILIVDDQAGIRLLLQELFKRENYETSTAENGLQALQLVEVERPDCVLLDMKMPGVSGIDVLKELKEKWPNLPVIMMTAYDDVALTSQAMEIGAMKYFTKPFDIFELRDAVHQLFEK